MNFRRLEVPSDEAIPYLKNDDELSQYWEQLNRECYGEIIIDNDTSDHIGHVFVWHTKKNKGFIFNLEVKPQYRHQGYGTILLDDAVNKYGGIDLLVDEDNIPAIRLYKKYGFETFKTVDGQLWMKLNKIKQEGVIMLIDRSGNDIMKPEDIDEMSDYISEYVFQEPFNEEEYHVIAETNGDYIDESSKTRKQIGRTAVAGYAIGSGVSLILLIGSMATGIPLIPGVHTLIEWILFTLLTSSTVGTVTGLLKTIKSNVPEKYAKNVTESICDVLKTMTKKTNEDNNEKTSEITSVKKFRKYNKNLYDELTTWSDSGKMLKKTFDALLDDLKISHMEMQSMCEYMHHHKEYSKEDVKKYTAAIETLLENIYNINDKTIKELYEEPFTEEEYQMFVEAKISAAERNELEDDDFGLVYEDEDDKKIRKYPLTDKQHVLQAVRFFGDCPDEYKPLLAHNILKRAKKFDMDDSNWDKIHEWDEKYSEDESIGESFVMEEKLHAAERNKMKDSEFGIPELRKYPLNDKVHVEQAVKMFGHCPPKYKKSLARRILSKAHKLGMDTSRWDSLKKVLDDNS